MVSKTHDPEKKLLISFGFSIETDSENCCSVIKVMRNQAIALHREYSVGFGGEDRVAAEKFMMRLFTFHNT